MWYASAIVIVVIAFVTRGSYNGDGVCVMK